MRNEKLQGNRWHICGSGLLRWNRAEDSACSLVIYLGCAAAPWKSLLETVSFKQGFNWLLIDKRKTSTVLRLGDVAKTMFSFCI